MTQRQMYVFDPKVINEQQCRDDALELIAKGIEPSVIIHKHRNVEECLFGVTTLATAKAVMHLDEHYCYMYTKETQ